MKNLTVLMVLVFSLVFSVSAFALRPVDLPPELKDSGIAEENFKKAGEKEMFHYETMLSGLRRDIEFYVDSLTLSSQPGILLNAIITGKDMKRLDNLLKKFDRAKAEADKNLEFYGLKTQTIAPDEIRKIRDIYFRPDNRSGLNFKDNEAQDIKRFFTEKSGVPTSVEPSPDYYRRSIVGLVCGVATVVMCLILLLKRFVIHDTSSTIRILCAIIPFLIILCLFLFIL